MGPHIVRAWKERSEKESHPLKEQKLVRRRRRRRGAVGGRVEASFFFFFFFFRQQAFVSLFFLHFLSTRALERGTVAPINFLCQELYLFFSRDSDDNALEPGPRRRDRRRRNSAASGDADGSPTRRRQRQRVFRFRRRGRRL